MSKKIYKKSHPDYEHKIELLNKWRGWTISTSWNYLRITLLKRKKLYRYED